MISYLQVVAPLPVTSDKTFTYICECPFFRGEGDVTLLVFSFSMNENGAETHSNIVN